MAKNKRDWASINARKGKRYVEREGQSRRSDTVKSERSTNREKSFSPAFNQEAELPENVIIGRNPVIEALKAGREIEKILIGRGAEGSVSKIAAMAKEKGIPLYPVSYTHLDVYKRQMQHRRQMLQRFRWKKYIRREPRP